MPQGKRNGYVGPAPISHGFFMENRFGDLVRSIKGHNLAQVVKELVNLVPVETFSKLKLLACSDSIVTSVVPGVCTKQSIVAAWCIVALLWVFVVAERSVVV